MFVRFIYDFMSKIEKSGKTTLTGDEHYFFVEKNVWKMFKKIGFWMSTTPIYKRLLREAIP